MSEPAGLAGGFSRFRIDFAYDGTDFNGWAKQPGLRTVQGDLLAVLEQIFGESENDFGMRVAGRTDAGVHADHQVCHIDLSEAQLKRLGRTPLTATRLNNLLPADIAVHSVTEAADGFDARFSAIGRSYKYLITDGLCKPNPKRARYALSLKKELDVDLMQKATLLLVGLKDFGAFCKPREGATTIRELRTLSVTRLPDSSVEVFLEADAFCHNMVRAIVGSLIAVGEKRQSLDELKQMQEAAKRGAKVKVVDPRGLTLDAISYPSDEKLAEQAQRARRRRTAEEISV
ncbi:MAG: tRNA pseudouridine(38-40) synthase TruA [Actinomycetota bacterium]